MEFDTKHRLKAKESAEKVSDRRSCCHCRKNTKKGIPEPRIIDVFRRLVRETIGRLGVADFGSATCRWQETKKLVGIGTVSAFYIKQNVQASRTWPNALRPRLATIILPIWFRERWQPRQKRLKRGKNRWRRGSRREFSCTRDVVGGCILGSWEAVFLYSRMNPTVHLPGTSGDSFLSRGLQNCFRDRPLEFNLAVR